MRAFARRGVGGGLIPKDQNVRFRKINRRAETYFWWIESSGGFSGQIRGKSEEVLPSVPFPSLHKLHRETVADNVAGTCLDGLILVDTENC